MEFIAEEKAATKSQQDRAKEVVEAEIKKVMACLNIFGFKKDVPKPIIELPVQLNRTMTQFFNSSDAFFRNLDLLPKRSRGLEDKQID